MIHHDAHGLKLLVGDCREQMRTLPTGIARTCVTSPPYWGLRDYGVPGQLGQEASPHEYVASLVGVFREVRRLLTDDGTLWLNLGDSYANTTSGAGGKGKQWTNHGTVQMRGVAKRIPEGVKAKDLIGIPWMVAFALREDGWLLRSNIIWHKPNPMPESVTDRPTKSHEHVFLFAKQSRYHYDGAAINEPATSTGGRRNKRDVWTITPKPFSGAHFATMPPDLVEPCIKAGSAVGDTVLDPFSGAGTTGMVARRLGRSFVGTELNAGYADITVDRWRADGLLL